MEIFKECYSDLYSSNDENFMKSRLGKTINSVSAEIEKVAKDVLDKKEPCIKWELIAWKAGRLDYFKNGTSPEYETWFESNGKHGKFCWNGQNGMGKEIGWKKDDIDHSKEIKINRINQFINEVNDRCNIPCSKKGFQFQSCKFAEFEEAYNTMLTINKNCSMGNFGAVYIITMIYFLSKRQFPIYDKYAHIAAKALYFDANPKDIHVGEAPGKDEKTKVFNMYAEYCWLLKRIFGKYEISREHDQALWVYGHSKKKYDQSIAFSKYYNDRIFDKKELY